MVGMPSGRSPPFDLGIIIRRTGSGRYVFETSSARKPANHADVLATDLVVEQIEAEDGLRLGFAVELSLKVPDLIRRCQVHHQSPSPRHLQKRARSRGPLLPRHYPASMLLLPRPTPAVTTA